MRHKTSQKTWYCDNCGGGYICEACNRQLVDAAVQAEREACAKVVEAKLYLDDYHAGARTEIAQAIRARTAQEEGEK